MSLPVVLLVLCLLLLISHIILRRFALRGLLVSRRFSAPAAFEGESLEVIEVVRNDRPLLIPWLRVESRISPHLRFGRQENLGVSGERYHRSLFMLLPYQQVTRRHRVQLMRRGAYDIGNAAVTAGDLLGVTCASEEKAMSVPVLVYPKLLSADQIPEPLHRLLGEYAMSRHLLTDPFLINGIRPYQPFDHVRDIHWAATARTGEIQVRTHDPVAQHRLMVVVNGQLSHHQWGDLMEYEQGAVESALSVAATLCMETLRLGLPCGFAANLPMGDSDQCAIELPASGSARDEALLSCFARLRVKFIKSFHEFLDELTPLSGLDFILLSAYDAPEIQQRIALLQENGNTVSLHLFDAKEGCA